MCKLFADPDLLAARLSAQEARTHTLQQKYNESLEEYKKRQEEVRWFFMKRSVVTFLFFFIERNEEKRRNSARN